MANQPLTSSAELFELRGEDLHKYWDALLERGLTDIKRSLKPNWKPQDIYAALRNGQLSCVIARRADRLLGFLVYGKQQRVFSYEPELFIWAAWNLPIKEWLPDDNMPAVVAQVWKYLGNVAKSEYKTDEISWNTRPGRARAFTRRYRFTPAWVTMTAKV